jgi:hypothetical protein
MLNASYIFIPEYYFDALQRGGQDLFTVIILSWVKEEFAKP